MESFIPELAIFGVPYVFDNAEHCWRVLDGEIGQRLLESGRSVGLRGLCYYDAGSRSFYTIDRPILAPEDLKGLKIRVQKSKTAMDMVEALGGSPTPIPWGELYTALQQGTVDGAENNPPSFYSNRHFEVCKHLTLDEHTIVPDMLMISEKVWQGLSPEVQQWLCEAAAESSIYQRKIWAEGTQEALEAVQAEGVTIHHPDKSKFTARVQEMHRGFEGTPVGELMREIKELRQP
jgi:tripartite ATP-independent transporter DctP family solute receptor